LDLSVIILNYRTAHLVVDCLASLATERGSAVFEVLVVDNASGDGSAERIGAAVAARGWSEWVRVLETGCNAGFSAGNNAGLRESRGAVCVLLNSDTRVRPGMLAELAAAMSARPDAGLISPRLEDPDGTPQGSVFRWPRPRSEMIRAACTGLVSRALRSAEPALGVFEEPVEVEWTSFAAVAIRRAALERIGPMDEGYFMYYEDIDYCRRAAQRGWKVVHWPRARAVHLRGGSSPVKSLSRLRKRRPAYFYASRARYYAKFYGRPGLWRANLWWMLGRSISLAREIVQRRPRAACEAEWRDNWTRALHPLGRVGDRGAGG